MPGINCPHCGLQMPFINDLMGQSVRCPECNGAFIMKPWNEATPPMKSAYRPIVQGPVPIDNRLLLGLTFGGISAITGGIGILMTTLFGIAWWALVAASFSLAGFIFTFSGKWRTESAIAIILSTLGAAAAIYLIFAGIWWQHGLRNL
jgi:DNA-directed RNA polymerase subunit RPC12/RpoP